MRPPAPPNDTRSRCGPGAGPIKSTERSFSSTTVSGKLAALSRRLIPLTVSRRDAPAQGRRPLHELAREFDILDAERREEVALALALLWDSFIDRFGGIDAFQELPIQDRDLYLQDLVLASARIRGSASAASRYYALAPAMFVEYLRLLEDDPSTLEREAMKRVADLIVLGREVRGRPRLSSALRRFAGG